MRNKLLAGVAVAMLALGGDASADGKHCIFDETPEVDACDHRWQDHAQVPEEIQRPKPKSVRASGCVIDDWRWSHDSTFDWITVEGTTTCPRAWLTIRAYGPNDKYLGNINTITDGYAFNGLLTDIYQSPGTLTIRYSTDQF